LAADAGGRLGAAGIAAWKRNDVAATIGLLRRATSLLDPESPRARELTCELGVALRAGGDAAGAIEALERASRPRSSAAEAHLELRARMELAFVRLLEGGRARDHELIELAETAIPMFEAVEDERALGRAWLLSSYVHTGRRLQCLAGGRAAELAFVHYQRAAWPPATCLALLAHALYVGPTPVETAAARCDDLLATAAAGPSAEANVSVYLAGLLAMAGRFADARTLVARARMSFEELGQLGTVASLCGEILGAIESLAGDAPAAESAFRESCELLLAAGLTSTYASRAGELATVLNAQGRYDEALEWTRAAERAGSVDDVHARLAWESARAQALARTGETREAELLARAAVAVAEETDALNRRATVFLAAADTFRVGGGVEEAAALAARARAEYERKHNAAALARLAEAARA
jgi:tetratricopeptide (TPR) repeat protein